MGKKVLLMVDVQNDFCTGGKLAVPGGEDIVPIINDLIENGGYDLIAASLDWHPADHGSFASQNPGKELFSETTLGGQPQTVWPDHCVQNTPGADFHPDLKTAAIDFIQKKGTDPQVDSNSAFRDNLKERLTGLDAYLKENDIDEIHICGLATDVCVKLSLLDAVELLPGVKVVFVEDASRGLSPEGVEQTKQEIKHFGIETKNAADLLPKKPTPPHQTKRQQSKKGFGR